MQNLNGIMLGAAILCTNLKAQMKIPVCVKKKNAKKSYECRSRNR